MSLASVLTYIFILTLEIYNPNIKQNTSLSVFEKQLRYGTFSKISFDVFKPVKFHTKHRHSCNPTGFHFHNHSFKQSKHLNVMSFAYNVLISVSFNVITDCLRHRVIWLAWNSLWRSGWPRIWTSNVIRLQVCLIWKYLGICFLFGCLVWTGNFTQSRITWKESLNEEWSRSGQPVSIFWGNVLLVTWGEKSHLRCGQHLLLVAQIKKKTGRRKVSLPCWLGLYSQWWFHLPCCCSCWFLHW